VIGDENAHLVRADPRSYANQEVAQHEQNPDAQADSYRMQGLDIFLDQDRSKERLVSLPDKIIMDLVHLASHLDDM
jgi:hypothetical protein